jgi:hypothetical protein
MSHWRALLAGLAFAMPGPALAQQLGGGGGAGFSIWRVLAALLVSLVAAVGVAVALRARNKGGLVSRPTWLSALAPVGRIKIIESRRIAGQTELTLVRCDGTEYLVLTCAGTATVVERNVLHDIAPEKAQT